MDNCFTNGSDLFPLLRKSFIIYLFQRPEVGKRTKVCEHEQQEQIKRSQATIYANRLLIHKSSSSV